MRIGPAVRYLVSVVDLTRQQEGWPAALSTGIRLVTGEARKVPRLMRVRLTDPSLVSRAQGMRPAADPSAHLNVAYGLAALAGLDIEVTRVTLDPLELEAHTRDYRYPRAYAGGSAKRGGAREAKILEYLFSLKLLDVRASDVVIDVASERSLFPDMVRTLIGAQVFRQDLMYPPGVRGDRIGGSAASMPIEPEFADKLTLHNSFEHFEGGADTEFVEEAWRLLRPGGKVCIVPLFLSERYQILTDPLVDTRDIEWDPDAEIVHVLGYRNRFGRFYSPDALLERVLVPARRRGFVIRLCHFATILELDSSSVLHFGLVLLKPTDADVGPPPAFAERPRNAPKGIAYSVGALVLTAGLWIILAAGVGQAVRASGVLLFLAFGPALLACRFGQGLGTLRVAVATACAAAAAGIVAGTMFAARIWAPEVGLVALSGLVALGALVDLSWRWLRRREAR